MTYFGGRVDGIVNGVGEWSVNKRTLGGIPIVHVDLLCRNACSKE